MGQGGDAAGEAETQGVCQSVGGAVWRGEGRRTMAQYTRADTIELELFGQTRSVAVAVPQGRSTLLDLLPPARALADVVANAGIAEAEKQQRTISCCAGCAACCRQMVGISAIEAVGVARTVAAMPPERRAVIEKRFADAVAQLESAGLLDRDAPKGQRRIVGTEPGQSVEAAQSASNRYFAQKIPCPFLEDESCSIYAERPLMCREYNVTSPSALCADFRNPEVRKVALPLYSGAPLGRVAAKVTGLRITAMPLTLALEFAAANAGAMSMKRQGEELYEMWLSLLDPAHDVPLDQRPFAADDDE